MPFSSRLSTRNPCAALFAVAMFGLSSAGCDIEPPGPAKPAKPPGFMNMNSTIEVEIAGVKLPELADSDSNRIETHDRVIGISVGDVHRAYRIGAFSGMGASGPDDEETLARHVVNDVVDGRPITVTFCDLTQCTRVFTGEGDKPLDVGLGGFQDRQMQLLLDGKRYPQSSEAIPLETVRFEITLWGDWKMRHPESKVYVGNETRD